MFNFCLKQVHINTRISPQTAVLNTNINVLLTIYRCTLTLTLTTTLTIYRCSLTRNQFIHCQNHFTDKIHGPKMDVLCCLK